MVCLQIPLLFAFFGVESCGCQMGPGHRRPPPPPGAKSIKCSGRPVPQLEDITARPGITFKHTSDPAQEIHRRIDERRRDPDRLRSRWLARHLFHQLAHRRPGSQGRKKPRRALPQQPRRHVYRRHRQGRVDYSLLRHGRRGWRLSTTTAGPISISPASAATFSIATTAMAHSPT